MTVSEAQRSNPFVGRDAELAFLDSVTTAPLPSVTFVSGIGGIGKSMLLDVFAVRRRAGGASVVQIDCRLVEPTEAGFFHELGRAVGAEISTCSEAAGRLADFGSVVLVFDEIDLLRLLDAWLRRSFVPAMPPNVHMVFSGQTPPLSAWLQMPWRGTFRNLVLTPLTEADALALLVETGIEPAQATRVNRVARGHPLALNLAALTLRSTDDPELEELAFHRIVGELARRHMEDIVDPTTRRAVEAASVVRSVSAPLLGCMLPDVAPSDAYERLRMLPLTQLSRDGLHLHESVRIAIAAELRSSDPERHLALRRTCWNRLVRDLRTAPSSDLWRYTADLLYLLENPVVREAFFPSGAQHYAVEPAQAKDADAVLSMTRHHDGDAAERATAILWETRPEDFFVARDRNREVAGYYVMFSSDSFAKGVQFDDAILENWLAHVKSNPVAEGELIFFLRRWLSRDEGEAPSPVQAACWVDIKRAYMANRHHLRRVYLALRDLSPYAAAASRLGFSIVDRCVTSITGESYTTAMLDFGPDSVEGWFARLVAAELGIATNSILDLGARELVIGSRRTPLTRREFDTFYYLIQRSGNVVNREELLDNVWDGGADVASNVIDVTVRSLRKKLAERASLIETVAGIGYRVSDDRAMT
jgi:hypothetical protein